MRFATTTYGLFILPLFSTATLASHPIAPIPSEQRQAQIAVAPAVPAPAIATGLTGSRKPTSKPTKKPAGKPTSKPTGGLMSKGINYHGGPIITGTTNIYYIYYGDGWNTMDTAKKYINNFAANIGGTPWYNIQTTYYNAANVRVSNSVSFAGNVTKSYTYGKSLTPDYVLSIVTDAIASSCLPSDTNGIYFVLGDPDVTETDFCVGGCGYHRSRIVNGASIKYAFVGHPAKQCPGPCAWNQIPNSISGDIGADAMANLIAHELVEAVTNPETDAWSDDKNGQIENADKCAWRFGTTYTTTSGAMANMKLGGIDYLIQTNWNAYTGSCELAY